MPTHNNAHSKPIGAEGRFKKQNIQTMSKLAIDNLTTLILVDRSLLIMLYKLTDVIRGYMLTNTLERERGMYRWSKSIKKNGNAFFSNLEDEYNTYYKSIVVDKESSFDFNQADSIGEAIGSTILHIVSLDNPNEELTKFCAFLKAYTDGDIKTDDIPD